LQRQESERRLLQQQQSIRQRQDLRRDPSLDQRGR
jgi:hypothetical protein